MKRPILIGVDWGSSNFRAYLFARDGSIVSKLFSPHGVFKLAHNQLASFFQNQLKGWLIHYPNIPVIMCGMIGSAKGWVETPYLACPVDLRQLAQALVEPPSGMQRCLRVISGVSQTPSLSYLTDVMRGEETQLIGANAGVLGAELSTAADQAPTGRAADSDSLAGTGAKQVFCLPGTHSKWVLMDGYVLEHFRTFMTGEVFSLLLQTKSLVRSLDGVGYQANTDWDIFKRGVTVAKESQALLADIFSIRSQLLRQRMLPEHIRDYLSGLLMAHEIMQAKQYADLQLPITLVASGMLAERYLTAFSMFDLSVGCIASEVATQRGLHYLAGAAGLY